MPKQKNANYDFASQKQPEKRMGQGSFANLPEKAMVTPLGRADTLRDGLVNSTVFKVSDKSGICENER
jgi:hypothetical protein